MKIETKAKIMYGSKAVFMLAAIFVWWRYTERTVWGFLGLFIVGMIVGGLIGWLVTLPFKDEEATAEENFYYKWLRYMNSKAQYQVAKAELDSAQKDLASPSNLPA